MKLNKRPHHLSDQRSGFTLIEMIGVLAVIAILAALLVPKVFNAINTARVNSAAVNCQTIKTAVADHYGKYGKLDLLYGTNTVFSSLSSTGVGTGYDTLILIPEGMIDKPFNSKLAGGDPSTNATVQICTGGKENGGAGYLLDGTNSTGSTNTQYVIEAVMYGVSATDAKELNDIIDGPVLGAQLGVKDALGRVEYAGGSPTTVYIYLTHR